MYQLCKYEDDGCIKVLASGLTIGEAASLRGTTPDSWMRFVRLPYTGRGFVL